MPRSAGIDWGSQQHAVCVVDTDGSVLSRFTVDHTAAGLAQLTEQLAGFGSPSQLPVAVERP